MKQEHVINYTHFTYATFHTEKEVDFKRDIYFDRRWIPEEEKLVEKETTTGHYRRVCEIHFINGESLVLYNDDANAVALRIEQLRRGADPKFFAAAGEKQS